MSARAEDAARALSREQPTTADAAVPAPANNGSADAEGVEIPAPEPSGNKSLLKKLHQWGSITGDNAFGYTFLGAQGVGGFSDKCLAKAVATR